MRGRGFIADLVQQAFFLLIVRPFLMLFIGLRVRGREHLPARGPFLLVANHTSHLDTVSLLALLPLSSLRVVRAVAAADYFDRNFLVSLITRTLFNILPIVRTKELINETNDPRKKMLEALREGYGLLIFPEGTRRSTADEIGRFKSGVATLIENMPGLPVVPAYLVNMGRSLPKGAWVPVPFFCEVHIGAPRVLTGTTPEIMTALAAAVSELKP